MERLPIKDFEGESSEELRMRKAHGTSDDGTENSGPRSGRESPSGMWTSETRRRQSPPELRERHSRAQRTKQLVQEIMRCTAEVMVHQQDLADAKAGEVAAQQGLAEAQSRVAKARQELADGIQNGLLMKVRAGVVEEALMTTVIRDGEPMVEGKSIMIPEHEPKPSAPELENAAEAHTPGELCLQRLSRRARDCQSMRRAPAPGTCN